MKDYEGCKDRYDPDWMPAVYHRVRQRQGYMNGFAALDPVVCDDGLPVHQSGDTLLGFSAEF